MKKLIILLSLILICSISFGQAIIQRSGVGNTVQDARLSAQYNLFVPRYADTTAALASNSEGIDSCGAIIFTYDQMALWFRSCSGGKSWVMLDPSGIPSTGNSWIIGGNAGLFTSPVDPQYIGTKTVQGFGIKTSDVNRLIMPAAGLSLLTLQSDTTLNKPMTYNTSTKEWNYGYWFGGGGGGATPISSLTAATVLNAIDNEDYAQEWSWNTLTGNNGLRLLSNSTTAAGNAQQILYVAASGVNANSGQTTYGATIENAHSGASSTNVALSLGALNGSTNIGLLVGRGSANFGTVGTESGVLNINGSTSGTITIQPQAAAGTYNFNLPTTAGTSGYLLTSAGGAGSPMTWTDPAAYTAVPTWQQTLTAGSTLTTDNSVDAGGNLFEIVQADYINLSAENTRGSNIVIYEDSIKIFPGLGHLDIDSLTNDVGVYALRWNPTTGLVSYADTTTGGGSGANTALSNLASVAVNTSLLPGVSDNIDLGSTTFQWRNLYLGEGQKIDWDNGDATLTQVGNNVTLDGAAFLVTNAEQTPASFSSSFAGNMQVNWNSTTGNNVNFVFQDAGTARWYIGNNSATGSDRLHILNASAAEAITVLQGLQVGINKTAPTARLHLGAGVTTASYAPLKFTSGPLNTTAEAGAVEFLTDKWYGTITTGAARKEFVMTDNAIGGNLIFTDNTYDIGASGATRPRTGYFGTSLFSPLIVGGTGTTDDLTFKTTTGVGASGADMHFQVGNNGATEAMTILNDGKVGITNTAPATALHTVGTVRIGSTATQAMDLSTSYISGSNSFPFGYLNVGAAGTAPTTSLFQIAPAYTASPSSMNFFIGNIGGAYTAGYRLGITTPTAVSSDPVAIYTTFSSGGTAWKNIAIGGGSSTGSAAVLTVATTNNVGIGQATPTGRLHIAAGTATASSAPIKLTTGVSLTTAEAGAIEYTTPQLFFTNGRAVRQEIFQGQQSRVSVQYDNATTTLGNVTGLTANVAASGTYRFEAKLYTTSDVAGGIKVAIGGTATATAIRYEGLTTDAGLTTQGRATALGTAVGAVTAVTAAYVVITGTITVNGAGTLTVQAAANAATGTTSVLTGSTFVITEML